MHNGDSTSPVRRFSVCRRTQERRKEGGSGAKHHGATRLFGEVGRRVAAGNSPDASPRPPIVEHGHRTPGERATNDSAVPPRSVARHPRTPPSGYHAIPDSAWGRAWTTGQGASTAERSGGSTSPLTGRLRPIGPWLASASSCSLPFLRFPFCLGRKRSAAVVLKGLLRPPGRRPVRLHVWS